MNTKREAMQGERSFLKSEESDLASACTEKLLHNKCV